MKTEGIIKNKLGFLITDYDFDFDYNSNGKEEWFRFNNKYGSISWYSYEQFGEFELSIIENGKERKILDSSMIIRNPILKIDKKKSFLGFLFKDQRITYWEQIAAAFKKQIIDTGSLFGLRIIKNK